MLETQIHNEASRLAQLNRYNLLDTPADTCFDELTALAQTLFNVPIILISLVDEDRLWFKSKQGISLCQVPRKHSFCDQAILQPDMLIVNDATLDPRFSQSPFVSEAPHVRFYAGCPIVDEQGFTLGTFCLMDHQPRQFTAHEKGVLQKLTLIVSRMMSENRSKQDIEREARAMQILIDFIPDALVACNSQGHLSQFNQVAINWHGVDVIDCDPHLLSYYYDLYEEDGVTTLAFERIPLIRAFNGEHIANEIICIKARDQEPRWVRCDGERMVNANGKVLGALILMHDLTEEKRLMMMKNDFISTVSHELRTPITAIKGSIQLLLNKICGELPEKALKLLNVADKNSERLHRLVNDLLDLEKLDAGLVDQQTTTLDLAAECEKAVLLNQPYADTFKVTIKLLKTASCNVKVDANRLQQVFSNLLSNAIKHSEPASRVTLGYELTGDRVRIEITDQGKGIPSHFQSRLFQRFVQADCGSTRQSQGTGLGLAICKAIVESMGGSIGFKSELGKGSVFYFELKLD